MVSSDALRGAAWSADGAIVYATLGGGLRLVASDGGPVRQLTEPDPSKGEADHRWPVFLPGGRHVLFTVHHASWRSDRSFVAVLSLETGRVTRILEGGVHARYLPTGHLVFGRDGVLLAVPLDVKRLAVGGIPTPVVNHVRFTPTAGGFDFDVAANGTLVYTGDAAEPPRNGLVWVTREGSVEPALPDRQPYMHINFALSPDGHRVAANVNGRPYASIWIYDLRDGRRQRLNVDADCYSPVWSPDGNRLAFDLEPRRRLEPVCRGGERRRRARTPGRLEDDAAAPLLVAGRPVPRVRAADTEERHRDARSRGRRTRDLAVGP